MSLDPKMLKRLWKGVDKKRNVLITKLHIKDDYIEVTNGRFLIREKIENEKKEHYTLNIETIERIDDDSFPDTERIMEDADKAETVFKVKLNRDLMIRFLNCIPAGTNLIWEFKGKDKPVLVRASDEDADKIKGVFLPMMLKDDE